MIAGMSYYQILQYFVIYSFLGWCVEVVYQAVAKGKIVNRGFLNGPVCPIYGFGCISVFALLNCTSERNMHEVNAFWVFVGGVVLATAIELFGGWALDKIFHARWWDYSNKPFNFHGYICLEFSLIWGLGIVFVVRAVHPMISRISANVFPEKVGWILMGFIYLVYAADFAVSVMIMVGLNKRMAELDELRAKMRVVSNELSQRLGEGALETAQKVGEVEVQAALGRAEIKDNIEVARREREMKQETLKAEQAARLDEMKRQYEMKKTELSEKINSSRHLGTGRVLRAFPEMEHRDHKELLEQIRKMLGIIILAICISGALKGQAQAASTESASSTVNTETPDPSSPLKVTPIDFGEEGWGDGTMIESGGECLLMDTFMPDCEDAIKDFLRNNGYKKFAIYLSHYHADHFGNIRRIMRDEDFEITAVYLPDDEYLTSTGGEYGGEVGWFRDVDAGIRELAKEKKIPLRDLRAGESFKLGDALVEVLYGPAFESDLHERSYINNNSLVTRITGGGIRFLTCGDIETDMEATILDEGIDVTADLYKMSHHGGGTSNSVEFLEAVDPSFAFFNSLMDSPYDFAADWAEEPVSEMMEIANVHSSRYNGDITYTARDGVITVKAERNVSPKLQTYQAEDGIGFCMVFTQFNDQQEPVEKEKMRAAAVKAAGQHGLIPAVYR